MLELELCPDFAKVHSYSVTVLDRCANANLSFSDHLDVQAGELREAFGGQQFQIIGFSIGAFVALELAARLGERVQRVDLASAAASIESGEFVNDMAGAPVFKLAMKNQKMFRLLTRFQAKLATFAPALMFWMLFRTAHGRDRTLSKQLAFRGHRKLDFAYALNKGRAGYERDVLAYVQPWSDVSKQVTAPVHIWHGTADNWSPPAMVDALAKRVPKIASVTILDGHAHYSTLQHMLQQFISGEQISGKTNAADTEHR